MWDRNQATAAILVSLHACLIQPYGQRAESTQLSVPFPWRLDGPSNEPDPSSRPSGPANQARLTGWPLQITASALEVLELLSRVGHPSDLARRVPARVRLTCRPLQITASAPEDRALLLCVGLPNRSGAPGARLGGASSHRVGWADHCWCPD